MSVANGTFSRTNLAEAGKNYPRFYVDTYEDEGASAREGRKIFKQRELVEIFMPGNPLTRPVELVNPSHIEMWPEHYRAFKSGMELAVDGVPLEEWPVLHKAQVLELKALGFLTVEHVRDMNDGVIQRVGMGARILKEKAAAFLDDAVAMEQNEKLSSELALLRDQNLALQNQVNETGALLRQVHAELQSLKGGVNAIQPAPGTFQPGSVPDAPVDVGSSLAAFAQAKRGPGRPKKAVAG